MCYFNKSQFDNPEIVYCNVRQTLESRVELVAEVLNVFDYIFVGPFPR